MTYKPHPIDTTDIRLPDEFLKIAELLAQNTHDVWAKARIAEGWTYGSLRDDSEKKIRAWFPMKNCPTAKKNMTVRSADRFWKSCMPSGTGW